MTLAQANNVTYELNTLGWKAFQNLCATIVSELWGQTVQVFFDSHDGGRDGAFHGIWKNEACEKFDGSFTVQCKFTSKYNEQIKLSHLSDELEKAKRLAVKGLADNYFLITNSQITGLNEEQIAGEIEAIEGIKKCKVYGVEWLSQKINESSRLRMLVPRIYGLGDLSQIMDERAYLQSKEIIGGLGDDLSKFVITNSFRNSSKALTEHGFVLLLGEPACGKSTIAAALALGELDACSCYPIKICHPSEFVKHWNPNECKQLFWVDDAFGATQADWDAIYKWNNIFPHIQTAIRHGAKVIFTSRDYIYKQARQALKEIALPLLRESQVVINVQDISQSEREHILYNHIKLGDQSKEYKTRIKQFLPSIIANNKFSPEIARRLGNTLFTKSLNISSYSIIEFVENPMAFLIDIIRTIDSHSRAALALVFMRGGTLISPIDLSIMEEQIIRLLASESSSVRAAFNPLDGSLLQKSIEEGNYVWKYKHPTIRDAFASLVAEDSELMDIYLTGVKLSKAFNEVTCGDLGLEGVGIIVPISRYKLFIKKIKEFDLTKWENDLSLNRFLIYRCNKLFLEKFLENFPDFVEKLNVKPYFRYCSALDLLIRLHEEGLLSESYRVRTVSIIKKYSTFTPDPGFANDHIRNIVHDHEYQNIFDSVYKYICEDLESVVQDWRYDYDGENDPEEYFDELKNTLIIYKDVFKDKSDAIECIESALNDIELYVDDLVSEYGGDEGSENFWGDKGNDLGKNDALGSVRSIFDDVDV